MTSLVATLFLLFSPLALSNEPPLPVTLEGTVDSAVATTTDLITYTITLKTKKGIKTSGIPEAGATLAGFRVTDFGSEGPLEEDEFEVYKKWYKLAADVSGSYVLPPIEVTYQLKDGTSQSAKTSEIFVEVQAPSSPTEGTENGEGLRDIKGLEPLGLHPLWYVGFGVLAFVLLTGGALWIYQIRKDRNPVTITVPPHEMALKRLSQLKSEEAFEQVKNFHFELSELLREYFEGRFQMPATDRTTEELEEALNGFSYLSEEVRADFLEILRKTDLVKFTDHTPQRPWSLDLVERSEIIVRSTQPSVEDQAGSHENEEEEDRVL